MVKVAVMLSGCGHLDGAEIRESVLALLYLDLEGCDVQCFAPNIEQKDVIDHRTGKPMDESRNVLTEAARIARGDIKPLKELKVSDYDALVFPGGFGAAKNLSDLAEKGADCTVLPSVKQIILEFCAHQKPVGAICIAPAMLSVALGTIVKAKLTIGDDPNMAKIIEKQGDTHITCATEDCVIDETMRIVTCPAYMREDSISNVSAGIQKCIEAVARMARETAKKAAS